MIWKWWAHKTILRNFLGRKIKIPLCNSITKSLQNGELSTSKRQTVIKLMQKKR